MSKSRNILVVLLVIIITCIIFATKQKEKKIVQGKPATSAVAVKGYELRMAGQLNEAKELLERHIKSNPGDASAYYELARTNFCNLFIVMNDESKDFKSGKKELKRVIVEANKAIEKAIKADPINPRYYYFEGVVLMYESISDMHNVLSIPSAAFKMSGMLDSYEKALELKPDYHPARLMVLGLYDRLPWYLGGDKKKARKYAEQLKRMDAVYGVKAECELKENRKVDKVALWRKVVGQNPDSAEAHEGLAVELMKNKRLAEAAAELEKTVELDPSRSILFLGLGKKALSNKKLTMAEKYTQRVLDLEEELPGIFRANALRQMGEIKKALSQEETAQALKKQADEITECDFSFSEMESLDLIAGP